MNLKSEFQASLKAGATHEALLALVSRFQAQGLTREQSYDVLEQIWDEHGFGSTTEESPMRHELEYVMEKIWYQGTDAA